MKEEQMDERSRVAHYRLHKDNPDDWGEVEQPEVAPTRGQMTATITVRFSPQEANLIRHEAKSRRISYSEVVRAAVAMYLDKRLTPVSSNETRRYDQPPNVQLIQLGGTLRQNLPVTGGDLAPHG